MFPVTSRYYGIEVATLRSADGRTIGYLRRRFLPDSTTMTLLSEHLITQGDRLDNVTALYLGDPAQFWRVCDANNAMHPDDLLDKSAIGSRLHIPLPQGS